MRSSLAPAPSREVIAAADLLRNDWGVRATSGARRASTNLRRWHRL